MRTKKPIFIAIILILLTAIGLLTYNLLIANRTPLPTPTVLISQDALAEQYGLKVQLVAVTAAGGLLDIRLRMVDGQKAKSLLEDHANFPSLLVGDGVLIKADEEITQQPIKFDDNAGLFVLYPNVSNIVKSGDPVTLVFGSLQLEPVAAK